MFLELRKAFSGSRISLKTFSWPILPRKKRVGKMATLGPNPWVNPFEKCQFVDFLNFLFLELRKACFGSGISFKTFSWLILPKKKKWKNGYFWAKTMGNPFKKCQFFDFLKFLFL